MRSSLDRALVLVRPWVKSAIIVATMAIAAMVNKSGLVASEKCGGLDSASASRTSLAAMR